MAVFCELKSFIAFLIFQVYRVERNFFLKNEKKEFAFSCGLLEMNVSLQFWENVLEDYRVYDRCKCNQTDYAICSSVFLKTEKKKCFFEKPWFVLNSNIGIFVFHTDGNGFLTECEMLFDEEIVPSFIFSLVGFFPSSDLERDKIFLEKLKKKRILSVNEMKRLFAIEDIEYVEIE